MDPTNCSQKSSQSERKGLKRKASNLDNTLRKFFKHISSQSNTKLYHPKLTNISYTHDDEDVCVSVAIDKMQQSELNITDLLKTFSSFMMTIQTHQPDDKRADSAVHRNDTACQQAVGSNSVGSNRKSGPKNVKRTFKAETAEEAITDFERAISWSHRPVLKCKKKRARKDFSRCASGQAQTIQSSHKLKLQEKNVQNTDCVAVSKAPVYEKLVTLSKKPTSKTVQRILNKVAVEKVLNTSSQQIHSNASCDGKFSKHKVLETEVLGNSQMKLTAELAPTTDSTQSTNKVRY